MSSKTSILSAAREVALKTWLSHHGRDIPLSTNQAARDLPIQRWYHFKEAFAPRFVVNAVSKLDFVPRAIIDPFGGSGTTALTCQFLGIPTVTIEVNPFLADVIRAKLDRYDSDLLIDAFVKVLHAPQPGISSLRESLRGAPPTFVEPGVNGRWVFDRQVLRRIIGLRQAIDQLSNPKIARLFRVLLGSSLVSLSNVVVNGKGRRYRGGWQTRRLASSDVDKAFEKSFLAALSDICRFANRDQRNSLVIRGDSRRVISKLDKFDFALFSPPYPNSFDYTDIYNLELWTLGYLKTNDDNRKLRTATLRSHVQIWSDQSEEGCYSDLLRKTTDLLKKDRRQLWNRNIPEMLLAYFCDLRAVAGALRQRLNASGKIMMVVGNSRYAGIDVDVAAIIGESVRSIGLEVERATAIRSMRASPQQGGREDLKETALILTRR